MTRAEAKAVRQLQLNGGNVTAGELQEAIFILSKRRNRRMVLPKLPEEGKALLNAALCFKLGRECGRTA